MAAPVGLPHGRLLLRLTVLAFGIVAVVSFVIDPLIGRFAGQFEDYGAYLDAARSMAHGQSPYAHFDPGASVVMQGFLYPPSAALLVRPLALLGDRLAMTSWLWLELACTIAGCLILARTALPASWPRTELAVLAALAFPPATYNYWHGQINPLVFLLLALAYRAWMRRAEVPCGVYIALAASLKVSPILLVILLLRRRWWRGVAACAATGALGVVAGIVAIGFAPLRTYVTDVLPAVSAEVGWIYNQSVGGVLSRLVGHAVTSRQPGVTGLHVAVLAVSIGIVAVAAWAVRPSEARSTDRSIQFGIGIIAMVLAESIAWYPHLTYLLIPVFVGLGVIGARGWVAERRLGYALGALLLAVAVLTPIGLATWGLPQVSAIVRGPLWWPFLQLCSLPAVAVACLLWALVRSGDPRRPALPASGPLSRKAAQ